MALRAAAEVPSLWKTELPAMLLMGNWTSTSFLQPVVMAASSSRSQHQRVVNCLLYGRCRVIVMHFKICAVLESQVYTAGEYPKGRHMAVRQIFRVESLVFGDGQQVLACYIYRKPGHVHPVNKAHRQPVAKAGILEPGVGGVAVGARTVDKRVLVEEGIETIARLCYRGDIPRLHPAPVRDVRGDIDIKRTQRVGLIGLVAGAHPVGDKNEEIQAEVLIANRIEDAAVPLGRPVDEGGAVGVGIERRGTHDRGKLPFYAGGVVEVIVAGGRIDARELKQLDAGERLADDQVDVVDESAQAGKREQLCGRDRRVDPGRPGEILGLDV